MTTRTLKDAITRHHGESDPLYVVVANAKSHDRYDDAVAAFAAGGSRARFMESMLALGIPAATIRWHVDRPGQRLVVVSPA